MLLQKGEKMSKGKMTLAQQAKEVLARAEEKGVDTNYFFKTTFKRYRQQMKILRDLEKVIKAEGVVNYQIGRASCRERV